MDNSSPPRRITFSANRCNFCIGAVPDRILTCTGCRLIVYCSPSHQKEDWPFHGEFCRAVQDIMKTKKLSHPLELNGKINNNSELVRTLIYLKYLIKFSLGRNQLLNHEEELTSFPRYCNVCFSYKTLQTLMCKKCRAVNYCSAGHRDKAAKEHEKDCFKLRLCYETYEFNLSPPAELIFLKNPQKIAKCSDLLEALRNCLQPDIPFRVPSQSDPTSDSNLDSYAFYSSFSCVSTIAYVTEVVNLHPHIKSRFVVYIVGANDVECLWFQKMHIRFLLLHLPKIKNLRIYMFGLELKEYQKQAYFILDTTIEVIIIKGAFDTMVQGVINSEANQINHPNLIMSFNCGFSENKDNPNDTWPQAIADMLHIHRVPIAFTSYTRMEATFDLNVVMQSAKQFKQDSMECSVVLRTEKNKFRHLLPSRNWEQFDEEDKFFYQNGYIQAVMTKSEHVLY